MLQMYHCSTVVHVLSEDFSHVDGGQIQGKSIVGVSVEKVSDVANCR